jgi:hypothetical protein
MALYVATDGVLYLDQIKEACTNSSDSRQSKGSTSWSPILLMIPIMLGLDLLNPIYFEPLKVNTCQSII